jgi:hypothetical protein
MEYTDEQRVCIGREGHVRVCQHKILSWSDVEEALNGCNESQLTLQCRDKSHRKLQLYSFREDYFPSIKIYGETKYINLQWQVAPLDMKAEQPATVRHIQNRLKTAELAATASLCPHESFDDISFLLRPFDPHQCGCTQSQSVFPMTHTMTDI